MEAGAVLFRDPNLIKKFKVEKKKNEILNRLNKTKIEKQVDFASAKQARNKEQSIQEKKEKQKSSQYEKEQREKNLRDKELRSYSSLMSEDNMTSNDTGTVTDDSFM